MATGNHRLIKTRAFLFRKYFTCKHILLANKVATGGAGL